MKTFTLFLCIVTLLSCSKPSQTVTSLTEIPFDVTGSAEAMPHFQKGLLLLHNFEYDDAATAFLEAQRLDPDFTMAYWGEALTYHHPVWSQLDIEKARGALNKIAATQEERSMKAQTQLEKDFIQSIEILFGSGSKPDRDSAYAVELEKMYGKYPDNTEVAAFYALALIGVGGGYDTEKNLKAGAVAKGILKEMPNHPGALHYSIHAYDHPAYANQALDAAYKYDNAASYSGHALHMPSHIYLSLGMWDNVVQSNEISWKAEADRKVRVNATNDALGYHAHLWLMYGYLQQGRNEEARELLENQIRFTQELPSQRARLHLLQMKGHYLVETGTWSDPLASTSVDAEDLTLEGRAVNRLIEGLLAFNSGDGKRLTALTAELEGDYTSSQKLKKDSEGITVCGSTGYDRIPSRKQLLESEIILSELRGLTAWSLGDLAGAERWLADAAAKETEPFIGPPDILKPAHELFGEFLFANERYTEADEQFEQALKLAPNRQLSLKGQLAVARATGDQKKAEELERRLAEMQKASQAGKAS